MPESARTYALTFRAPVGVFTGLGIAGLVDRTVVRDADGVPWWASGTSGNSGAELVLRNDGDLLVQLGSAALWESGTGGQ